MAATISEAAQCSKQYTEILFDLHMDSDGKALSFTLHKGKKYAQII